MAIFVGMTVLEIQYLAAPEPTKAVIVVSMQGEGHDHR